MSSAAGKLVVVGTGIKALSHLTLEALSWIRNADVVWYLSADTLTESFIQKEAKTFRNLYSFYQDGVSRSAAYDKMIEAVLNSVRSGDVTCMALYGHPGVFVYPSHKAIEIARREGLDALMLPGVSAEDCIFADLGFDPARRGCSSFECTDFLLHERSFDPTSYLILWQIGLIGDGSFQLSGYKNEALPVLGRKLSSIYGEDHYVIVYEASEFVIGRHKEITISLRYLESCKDITPISTLVVPPLPTKPVSKVTLDRIGIKEADLIVEPQATVGSEDSK